MSTKSSKNKYSPEPVSSRSTYIIGGLAVLVIAALWFLSAAFDRGRLGS